MMLPFKYLHSFSVFIAIFTLVFASVDEDLSIEIPDDQPSNHAKDEKIAATKNPSERKWVSELFSEGRTNFDMSADVNSECKRDYELYKQHLRNTSVWAVRMLESSQWPYVGIFSGMTHHLGNWRECLMVSQYNITGKYCLVNAAYENQHEVINISEEPIDEAASVWNAIELLETKSWKVSRSNLSWALCLPASCQPTDIEKSLNQTLYPLFKAQGLNITVNVNPNLCSRKIKEEYSLGLISVCGFLVTLLIMVVVSTIKDLTSKTDNEKSGTSENESTIAIVFEAFSVVRNIKKLTQIAPKNHGGGVHFLKIVYMCLIIYGHRAISFYDNPKFNPEFIEKTMYSKDGILLALRGLLTVDIFLAISGYFTYYSDFFRTRSKGINYVFQTFILRWARMVPVFLVLALFIIYVLPYMSDGPLWNYKIQIEADNCKASFWENVFAVGNIFNTERMCLYTSWYISVDVQLAIVGGFLTYIIAKNENLGISLTILTYLASVGCTFIVTYVYKYHAIVPAFMNSLGKIRDCDDFTKLYVTPFTKCSSYVLGFGAAIVTRKLKEIKFTFTNIQMHSVVMLMIVIKISVLLYTPQLYEFYKEYNRLENAFNAALLRTIFIMPDCICLCAYFTSGWGVYSKYFDREIWVPFGRLLYSVFLVHVVIQEYHIASQQVLMPSSGTMSIIFLCVTDTVLAFTLAFFMHLLIEAPITILSKYVVQQIFREKKLDVPVTNTDKNGSIKLKEENCKKPKSEILK